MRFRLITVIVVLIISEFLLIKYIKEKKEVTQAKKGSAHPCECYDRLKSKLNSRTTHKELILPNVNLWRQHAKRQKDSACVIDSFYYPLTFSGDTLPAVKYKALTQIKNGKLNILHVIKSK